MKRLVLIHCVVLFVLAGPALTARATRPIFIPFEELVTKADFVGIVECETAGGVVARYKVIESCRGPKAGEKVNLRIGVNYWGQQFQIALCGERYLFTAFRTAPDLYISKSVGGGVPLWWRQLHADYEIPFHQGRWAGPKVNELFDQAKKLLANKPAAVEKARPAPKEVVWTAPKKPRPSDEQLNSWRKQIADEDTRPDAYAAAMEGLMRYDPAPFGRELIVWTPTQDELPLRRVETIYAKASYFAWRCSQDRSKHLEALLQAKEPLVRVAGAVYLCFENEKRGLEALNALTKLDGEAGAWAALTLARRGQKNALPIILDLFREQEERQSHMHDNLRNQALVLLSNSAKASKVPQPPVGGKNQLESLRTWWREHEARMTLQDPWLEILSKQKID